MTIVLQPGQELRVIAADGSGALSRSTLGLMAAGTTRAAETDISPSRDPDTDISPSASKDLSGRP